MLINTKNISKKYKEVKKKVLVNTFVTKDTKNTKSTLLANQPIPIKICCKSIKQAWGADMIGFFEYTEGPTVMTWSANDFRKSPRASRNCIFCGKQLELLKNHKCMPS